MRREYQDIDIISSLTLLTLTFSYISDIHGFNNPSIYNENMQ